MPDAAPTPRGAANVATTGGRRAESLPLGGLFGLFETVIGVASRPCARLLPGLTGARPDAEAGLGQLLADLPTRGFVFMDEDKAEDGFEEGKLRVD